MNHELIPIRKGRALTVLILVVSYLLLAVSTVSTHPLFPENGRVQVTQTDPISQIANQTVIKQTTEPIYETVLLNETTDTHWARFPVSVFDINTIDVSVYFTPKQAPVTVTVKTELYSELVHKKVSVSTLTPAHTTLTLTTDSVRNESSRLFHTCYLSVYPDENITNIRFEAIGYSSKPLYPVTIDIKSTNGLSIFEYPHTRFMVFKYPYLYLGREDNETEPGFLPVPHKNFTICVSEGNYSGYFQWERDDYVRVRYPVNATTIAGEKVLWAIRVPVVEAEIRINPKWPLVHLGIYQHQFSQAFDDIYNVYLNYSRPLIFLIPISEYVTRFRFDVLDPFLTSQSHKGSLLSAGANIQINGTHNILMEVEFPHLNILGVVFTFHDFAIFSCSFLLMVLIVIRLAISFEPDDKVGLSRDPRILPILFLMGLTFVPWFSASKLLRTFWGRSPHATQYGLYFGPFPLLLSWTNGSSSLLLMPGASFYWGVFSLLIYCIPLTYFGIKLRSPSSFGNDIRLGAVLFLPFFFGLLHLFFTAPALYSTTALRPFPAAFLLLLLVPLLWYIVIVILRVSGKYVLVKPDPSLIGIYRLVWDIETIREMKNKKSDSIDKTIDKKQTQREKRSPQLQKGDLDVDVGVWVFFLTLFVLLLPYMISAHYSLQFDFESMSEYWRFDGCRFWFVVTDMLRTPHSMIFPVLYWELPLLKVLFVLITLPYTTFSFLFIRELYKLNRELFDSRIAAGYLFASYLCMIPGTVILNWFGNISAREISIWVPLPIAFIVLAIALLYFLYKARSTKRK